MRRRPPLLLLPILILAGLLAAGCDDNATAPGDQPFRLDLTVRGPAGQPVAGLAAAVYVRIPDFPVSAAKAVTSVQFSTLDAAHVSLRLYDLEDRLALTVYDDDRPAGIHQIALASPPEDGILLGTRVYRYELVATVDGEERFRDSKFLTVFTGPDVDERPSLGTTDGNGRLQYADKTQFPFLYGLDPQPMLDENGELVGTFTFDDTVVITLSDPATGDWIDYEVAMAPGLNRAFLTWDADKAHAAVQAPTPTPAPTPAAEAAPGATTTAALPPDPIYELRQNFPNPFN